MRASAAIARAAARRVAAGFLGAVLLAPLAVRAEGPAAAAVRPPAWAGSFYPADPQELAGTIDRLLAEARRTPRRTPAAAGPLRALVLPHAGYRYSGPVAARGLLALEGNAFRSVILLGPDHRVGLRGVAVSDADRFQTPLGLVALHPAVDELRRQAPLFIRSDAADRQEHSLEVLLPLLQRTLPDLRLVPLIVGAVDSGQVAEALAPLLDAETLMVVSSDLSHFLPDAAARQRDQQTIAAVLALDGEALARIPDAACGAAPLQVLMALARDRGWQAELIDYANSGDTSGERQRVVGYAAIAFYGAPAMPLSAKADEPSTFLTPEQGERLVLLARRTIAAALGEAAESPGGALVKALADPVFDSLSGTFVTLTIGGQLRGCIGSLQASEPLREGVRRNALNAAFHDPRFSPLKPEELARVAVEVSVLNTPRPLSHRGAEDLVRRLRPDVDGVILRRGGRSATFLPQVWQQLPQPADFLTHLSRKAGLPGDAWRQADTEILTYQVQVFHEAP